jgi:predicted phosphohydrolase
MPFGLRWFRKHLPCLPCCKTPVDQCQLPKCVVDNVLPTATCGTYRIDLCVDDETFLDTTEPLDDDQETRSITFVCISDTHSRHNSIPLPDDPNYILIHTGDFSDRTNGVTDFNTWLGTLPYKEKIVIAGNHEVQLSTDVAQAKAQLYNCTYLCDSATTVEGVQLFGSPHHPKRGCCYRRDAFGAVDQARSQVFQKVPKGCHLLLSHCPPFGIRDEEILRDSLAHVGCGHCLKAIQRIKPHAVVFGHCHQWRGVSRMWHDGGQVREETKSNGNSRSSNDKGTTTTHNHNQEEIIAPSTIQIELSSTTGKTKYRRRSSAHSASSLLVNAASIQNDEAEACGGVAPPILIEFIFHRVSAAEKELVGIV